MKRRWAAVSAIGDVMLVQPEEHLAWRSSGRVDEPEDVLGRALAELSGRSVLS